MRSLTTTYPDAAAPTRFTLSLCVRGCSVQPAATGRVFVCGANRSHGCAKGQCLSVPSCVIALHVRRVPFACWLRRCCCVAAVRYSATYLGRLERVVLRQLDVDGEDASLVRPTLLRSTRCTPPSRQATGQRHCGDARGAGPAAFRARWLIGKSRRKRVAVACKRKCARFGLNRNSCGAAPTDGRSASERYGAREDAGMRAGRRRHSKRESN